MALLLIPLSIFFIFLAYKLYQQPKFKIPPGPHPWPIIGNILDIKLPTFQSLAKLSHTYGPITSIWLGSSLNINVSNSELAREVLKENDHQLANRHRNKSVTLFTKDGNDLTWADYGPHYVKVRKVCTLELFSPKSIDSLRPIREYEIKAMVGAIFKDCTNPSTCGKALLVRNYLREVSFNVITRMVLGKRFGGFNGEMDNQLLEFKDIVADELKLGAPIGLLEYIPWLQWVFWFKKRELDKHGERRSKLTRAIMEEHKIARKENGVSKQHFVDALLRLRDEYDLCEDTIVGLLWDMISAGTDTSAIVVEWAMAELVKNPTVLNKVQEELDRIIGLGHVLTECDLVDLPYLKCVVKEALRLHPPTPLMLPHRANVNVKIGGFDVPQGSNVHVNVWAIGRDPTLWRDPLGFRPERFLEEDIDMKGHDFRLLPFGAGRRMCPGAQLGINLVTSMLGHLLHHFNWSLPQGVKPEDIDMLENPGLVAYMRTPLEAVPTLRLLNKHLYKH